MTGGIDGNYYKKEWSYLLSPVFDFSALERDPIISVYLWYISIFDA
jgi:hypothetical protein